MTMAQWIDESAEDGYQIGQVGFLTRTSPQGKADIWRLCDRPLRTNQSHEPRLTGWCGETNNVNRNAEGMARVVRIARNGRALVMPLEGAELTAALEELGYPELDPAEG